MKIMIVAVGTKMPGWVQTGYDEYAKRLPRELLPQLVELPLGPRSKNGSVQEAIRQEGEAILAAVPAAFTLVALDLRGKAWTTEQLSGQLARWQMEGDNVAFAIGGPDGFHASVLMRARLRWTLSDLTLPHPLVRIVLIEQLYRAWTILQNHPYHK